MQSLQRGLDSQSLTNNRLLFLTVEEIIEDDFEDEIEDEAEIVEHTDIPSLSNPFSRDHFVYPIPLLDDRIICWELRCPFYLPFHQLQQNPF